MGQQQRSPLHQQRWRIVGGNGHHGILAREGKDRESCELHPRVAVGSIVEQVELAGKRLHYRLLSGKGPSSGWITTEYNCNVLAERIRDAEDEEEVTAPVMPLFMPGDLVHVWSASKRMWAEDGIVHEVASEEVLVEGQRMPEGSLLVAYDGGKGIKWVGPLDQPQVLKKMQVFAPGDRVGVWSVSNGSWAEDGEVQDVATELLEIDGQEVPRGSAFVVYNGGAGLKCIPPSQQSQILHLLLPAPAWFTIGDKVHVWSVNRNAWIEDGIIEQVASEDLLIAGQQVARGAVFATYDEGKGMKWVMPWEQEQLLRHLNPPVEGLNQPLKPGGLTAETGVEWAPGNNESSMTREDIVTNGAAAATVAANEEEEDDEVGELVIAIENWEPPTAQAEQKPLLALLHGSVVTVLHKEDDMLYGRRSDGAKGWFPKEVVKPDGEFCLNESSSEDEKCAESAAGIPEAADSLE